MPSLMRMLLLMTWPPNLNCTTPNKIIPTFIWYSLLVHGLLWLNFVIPRGGSKIIMEFSAKF